MNIFLINVAIILVISISNVHPWTGILLNSFTAGTQLYFPTTSPHNVGNVTKFKIPPVSSGRGVMFNGKAYFMGGYDEVAGNITSNVSIFDPSTNKTIKGPSLLTARDWFSTSVLQDSIVVCGGDVGASQLAT